jgi:hypothetical protein
MPEWRNWRFTADGRIIDDVGLEIDQPLLQNLYLSDPKFRTWYEVGTGRGSVVDPPPTEPPPTATPSSTGVFGDKGLFKDLLAEDPRAAFFSFAPKLARTQSQREFFQDFFPTVHDEFLGQVGSGLRQQEISQTTFTDFLGKFPFLQRYLEATAGERATAQRRLAPPVKSFF